MGFRLLSALVLFVFAASDLSAGSKDTPGAIRIRLSIPRTDSPEKDGERLKMLHEALKERGVHLDDLRIGTSTASSCAILYDPNVPTKRLLGLMEYLLDNGIRVITLEPTRPRPLAKEKLGANEKAPPLLGEAKFLRLVLIEEKNIAYLRNLIDPGRPEWRLAPGDEFKFESEKDVIVTCKVAKIEAREIVIVIGKAYHALALGSNLADALKEPISKERIKELKLSSPP